MHFIEQCIVIGLFAKKYFFRFGREGKRERERDRGREGEGGERKGEGGNI